MAERVAFVTGASRGIGKASSLALAEVGYDVVATARTLKDGERYEHSPTLKASDTRPLPGSLEETAGEIRAHGRRALAIRLDLLEPASLDAAVQRALGAWGRIDLLLNNAVYTGPGSLDRFQDLPLEVVQRIFQANVFAQMHLTQLVLPGMLARGEGIIVNMTSGAALTDPPAPAGEGGWGVAYAASKGAFHRLAGILRVELAERGIRAYNVEPGLVLTEAMKASGLDEKFAERFGDVSPRVPAAVVAWLASHPDAEQFNGETVHAQSFYEKHALA